MFKYNATMDMGLIYHNIMKLINFRDTIPVQHYEQGEDPRSDIRTFDLVLLAHEELGQGVRYQKIN